ncbi:MAG: hypothetical protein ACQETH_16545 [Candidatus Rifleibacteriota bacterium]
MLRDKLFKCLLIYFLICPINPAMAFGPTITENGVFKSLSSHQIVLAEIDDKLIKVCLPEFQFKQEINARRLKKEIENHLKTQKAVFHLYHDGLGSPLKKGGMLYASDFYLRDLKMTYTGFLHKLGMEFKVSKTPPHKDKNYMRNILYGSHVARQSKKQEESEDNKEKKEKKLSSKMRVTTIWDVLPAGVIPPRIRKQQKLIDARIKALKNRPYKKEVVVIDPLRWASGIMGTINENGTITGSNVEGQHPELHIVPPNLKNWLSPQMKSEIKGQPCEFVLQLTNTGHEVKVNNKYYVRDIYFRKLKLSWQEWLEKHKIDYTQPTPEPDFATNTIKLNVELASGKFEGFKAMVLCGASFPENEPLVNKKETLRIFPPDPMPKRFVAFARRFNQLFSGKNADFSLLVCSDGKPYTELGQKRARRIYFPEKKATMKMLEYQLLTGRIK